MGEHIAEIVCATAGRDKGKYFIVTAKEDNFVYLCNGKCRKVGSPKKKKVRHVVFTGEINEFILNRLTTIGKVTNKEVRYALSDYEKRLSQHNI
jgi:ribosomal protein L14E/L6E/L27E